MTNKQRNLLYKILMPEWMPWLSLIVSLIALAVAIYKLKS
jgi:hypothetical protein